MTWRTPIEALNKANEIRFRNRQGVDIFYKKQTNEYRVSARRFNSVVEDKLDSGVEYLGRVDKRMCLFDLIEEFEDGLQRPKQ